MIAIGYVKAFFTADRILGAMVLCDKEGRGIFCLDSDKYRPSLYMFAVFATPHIPVMTRNTSTSIAQC